MSRDNWEKALSFMMAAIALAYLIYALAWQDDELRYLHILVLLFAGVMILAPFVTKLRIPNIIEFENKVDALREKAAETDKQLADFRTDIVTTIQTQLSPVQHQYTFLGVNESILRQMSATMTGHDSNAGETATPKEKPSAERQQRLRHMRETDRVMLPVLFVARAMQVSMQQHRGPQPEDFGDITKIISTSHLLDQFVGDGIEFLFSPESLPKVTHRLQSTRKLLEIHQRVKDGQAELPPEEEIQTLAEEADMAFAELLAVVSFAASAGIVARRNILDLYEDMQKGSGRRGDLRE